MPVLPQCVASAATWYMGCDKDNDPDTAHFINLRRSFGSPEHMSRDRKIGAYGSSSRPPFQLPRNLDPGMTCEEWAGPEGGMETSNGAPGRWKYPVFISYSHRDERWASWLHKGIEGYRVPKPLVGRPGRDGPIPKHIFPVFRDRDELASSADLPSVLREALAESAHLIVVCSPAAAQSRWVNEEILEFKRRGRADRILPLIVDGEPHAATPERECFPTALSFRVDVAGRLTDQPVEPIAADLRPEADGQENARLKLIAGVLGVPFNDLRQRELIAARRRARIWQGIGAAMLLLAMLATAGGWTAWRYARHAEGLLAEGIRISADQVGAAAHVADRQGVSRRAIEDLLARAESAFEGLYRKTAEAPRLPWRQATTPARLRGQYAMLLLVLADHNGVIGNTEKQRVTAEHARALLAGVIAEESSIAEWHEQLALSNDLIADAHAREWHVDRALTAYQEALTIRNELAARDPRNARRYREIALSHINIGDMLRRQARWGPALEDYRAAVGSLEQLVADAPSARLERDLLIGRQRVGDVLLKQGEHDAAEAAYAAALGNAERLSVAGPDDVQAQRDLAVSQAKLGDALERQGRHEAALARYEASRTILQPLAAADSTNLGLQRDVFKTHESIGNVRLEQGRLNDARAAFETALAIAGRLAAADPTDGLAQRELSVLRNRLGDVLQAQGRLDAALTHYRKAQDARRTLAAADLTNAQAQRDLLLSQERVSDVLRKQARWREALVELEASLAIAQGLLTREPSNSEWQRELMITHSSVARVLDAQGRSDAAREAYQAALAAAEQLARAKPSDVDSQRDLLARYSELAQLQERRGSRTEAQQSYCRAKAIVLVLTELEPERDEWRERRTWVEDRLRETQGLKPTTC
jgi:tetratricopeptide (TPR) repeat protein